MTLRRITYCSFQKLPCANAERKDVVLCLQDSSLVVQPDQFCHISVSTIYATVVQAFTLTDSCLQPNLWQYVFEYDDDQLLNPPLATSDIVGVFCENCETDWILQQIGCDTPCVVDSATIDFSVLDACVTGSVKISADSGNIATAHLDGIYVPGSGVCVSDSDTIDFSIDGGGCVTGDVKISLDANNILSVHADGLYVPEVCVSDTATIDFSIDGGGCVTGSVKISADAGNIISAHADGIYATGGGPGGDAWLLLGNTGTVDGTNFLGTIDNVAHDIRVNNLRARRSEPHTDTPVVNGPYSAPNVVDGTGDNSISGIGSTIGGGGYYSESNLSNFITQGYYTTISGGGANRVFPEGLPNHDAITDYGGFSTIGGGADNRISWNGEPSDNGAGFHTVGGGQSNIIDGAGGNATIGGGFINLILYDANLITASDGFASIDSDTIAGGNICSIFGQAPGSGPLLVDTLGANFIGGGETNEVHNGIRSAVVGGWNNTVNIYHLTNPYGADPDFGPVSYDGIVSGVDNSIIIAQASFIGAGQNNLLIGDGASSILGGFKNLIFASSVTPKEIDTGNYDSIVPQLSGGSLNVILGGFGNFLGGTTGSSILGGAFLSLGSSSIGFQSASTRSFAGYTPGATFSNYVETAPASIAQVNVSAFPSIGYFGDIDLWIANTDNTARKVKFWEPNTDTTFAAANYSSFEAQGQAANIEYKWPASAGAPGQQLTIDTVVGTVVTLKWA